MVQSVWGYYRSRLPKCIDGAAKFSIKFDRRVKYEAAIR